MDSAHNHATTVPADAVCDCYEIFVATGTQCFGRCSQVFSVYFQWSQMPDVLWKRFQVVVRNASAGVLKDICF